MRIDVYMTENGLAESRSRAQAMIAEGFVLLNGKEVKKPSVIVNDGDTVTVTERLRFVSRGGEKLLGAIKEFSPEIEGMICVDIGASTGGFTDCLLQHGAMKVYAVDSGTDQLHPSIAQDPRVVKMEKTNARALTWEMLGEKCDLAVMDVSFISQTLLYPAVKSVLKENGRFISLIKPQFETNAKSLGSGGILRDPKTRQRAVDGVLKEAERQGLKLISIIPSPITGGDGNTEYLAYFTVNNTQ